VAVLFLHRVLKTVQATMEVQAAMGQESLGPACPSSWRLPHYTPTCARRYAAGGRGDQGSPFPDMPALHGEHFELVHGRRMSVLCKSRRNGSTLGGAGRPLPAVGEDRIMVY
jgi:hypothetical protein